MHSKSGTMHMSSYAVNQNGSVLSESAQIVIIFNRKACAYMTEVNDKFYIGLYDRNKW